jgi:hypothetical protein
MINHGRAVAPSNPDEDSLTGYARASGTFYSVLESAQGSGRGKESLCPGDRLLNC